MLIVQKQPKKCYVDSYRNNQRNVMLIEQKHPKKCYVDSTETTKEMLC